MKKYIDQAKNIQKNQGTKMLVRKGYRFSRTKVLEVVAPGRLQFKYKDLWEEYAFVSNPIFQITAEDIEKSKRVTSGKLPEVIKTANWFVPNFDHIKFGGIYTIFRFIEKASADGIYNRIIIYDNPSFDLSHLESEIKENFPELTKYELIIFDHANQDVDEIPECDIAFCSFWVSAYLLIKFNKTKRKYYFVQDYEPLFYPGGSTYALAESTYRFGFRGLVNTPGLLAAINQRHGMEGVSFIPAVDQSLYTPDFTKKNERTKVFFYARPKNPRNAFNLGVTIIKQLLDKYGDSIEIVTAGADWEESAYDLKDKITNLKLLKSLDEVAALYRSCDIGFCYMLSKHPSYQPFEFMASGMATVTNNNEDNLWLLKDGENCLLSEPSASAMTEKISMLIDDEKLRRKIADNGLKTLGYTWPQQTETIWNDIRNY
ncbi:glycosyltransferase family 4 protein [Candidatus Saccharibacteria bacterium]|nr:glycosyltransferase family 4 protein [Candidatus Saccharibacteria bacterium]